MVVRRMFMTERAFRPWLSIVSPRFGKGMAVDQGASTSLGSLGLAVQPRVSQSWGEREIGHANSAAPAALVISGPHLSVPPAGMNLGHSCDSGTSIKHPGPVCPWRPLHAHGPAENSRSLDGRGRREGGEPNFGRVEGSETRRQSEPHVSDLSLG